MTRFDFATCFEVDDELIAEALAPAGSLNEASPRDKVLALLERMAEVSSPRQGASRALIVLAGVCGCSWLEGTLNVKLGSVGDQTIIELAVDDGLNLNRLHSPLVFHVPLLEFEQTVRRRPADIQPLYPAKITNQNIELHTGSEGEATGEEAVASSVFRPERPLRSAASGAGPQHTPTVKVRAVKIPPEAYREDDPRSRPPGPMPASEEEPDAHQAETAPPPARESSAPEPVDPDDPEELPELELELEDEVASPTSATTSSTDDDIDEGWG